MIVNGRVSAVKNGIQSSLARVTRTVLHNAKLAARLTSTQDVTRLYHTGFR